MQQVQDVREMRRNLTTLRDQLVLADVSEEAGPFRVRLDQAVADVQHLLIYVSYILCHAGIYRGLRRSEMFLFLILSNFLLCCSTKDRRDDAGNVASKGPLKCYVMQWGRRVNFPEKKRHEGVQFKLLTL